MTTNLTPATLAAVEHIEALTVPALYNLAETSGAGLAADRFLTGIRDDIADRARYNDDLPDEGDLREVADLAVPIYTADVFATLVETRAYAEDVSDLKGGGEDLEQLAKIALYIVAERVATAIVAEAREVAEEHDADSSPFPGDVDEHGVRVLEDDDLAAARATCGECGRSWDDGIVTSVTPAPSGRCPFEYAHA